MYVFVDSKEVLDAFSDTSVHYDEVYVVEIELTDFDKSWRPNPAVGIAVALDIACRHPEAPVLVAAKREYDELEGWATLISMKNVFLCLMPLSSAEVEDILKKAFIRLAI